jgi:eukaryotic-like serine/threonine-protein kinase
MDSASDPIWQRWDEVNRLFDEAVEVPEARRSRFLEEVCGADDELKDAVAALLRADRESAGMFEHVDGASAEAALADRAGIADRIPRQIGPYHVTREIGRGGMGTIFLAERVAPDFRQTVAVKVLRRGIDTDDVVRRFVIERRILADLAHPNIARLIDGGATAEGQPYFVMEYIEGTRITAYCDERALPVRARLALFLEVAEAVRYAHTKLVVHRDLKPSNILVTARGDVKLLDFGIAKLLDPDAGEPDLTRTSSRVLTPQFASPEQIRGDPVTTGSDIYQLGVLLHVLLTGAAPFGERQHTGRRGPELAPRLPSSAVSEPKLRAALRGDLDTIVLKAMQHEPERRYESVERFADDVRRHLQGRPVSARPDTHLYRAGRFLQRNRWVAPAAALAVVVITSYLAITAQHTRELARERNVAREEAERAQEVQQFLVDLFGSADPFAPADPVRGRAITVLEAMDIGAARAERELAGRPRVHAALLETIARVYARLGQQQRAVPLAEQAVQLQESLHGTTSTEYRAALGTLALAHEGDTAIALMQRRLAMATEANGTLHPEAISARVALASRLVSENRPVDGEVELQRVLALADSTRISDADMAAATFRLADLAVRLGRPGAETHARAAIELNRRVHGAASPNTAMAHESLARALGMQRRHEEAAAEFEHAVAIFSSTLGEDNANTLATLNNLAMLQREAGSLAEAESAFRSLLERRTRIHGQEHVAVGSAYQNLGTVLVEMGRVAEALDAHMTAATIYDAVLGPDIHLRGLPYLSIAGLELERGDFAAAESSARRAFDVLGRALPTGHYATAVARCRVGRALAGRGRAAEAVTFLAEAADVIRSDERAEAYREECLDALATLTG